MAADDSLSTPFLATRPSDHHPHVVLDVNGCDNPARTESARQNPFEFIGAHGRFEVPGSNTVEPFRNGTPGVDGVYEWLKIVICLPVAALRLVFFGFCLMVGYVATVLALHGWKDKQNPLPRWRCRVMWVTRLCARAILFSFGYHWIKRRGMPASREIAPIVVSNHVSYIEPIFFFFDLFPTIVSSESHDSMPFVGTIIRAMQVIYVDRFSKSSRKHAVNEIKRKASSSRFPRVLLFPEGTRSNGRVLMSFQLGAFIPGHTVQPVIVRYPHIHFDQSWGNIPLGKLMFRMFTQFHNFMEVEYLPVVTPNENRKENAICFAQRTSHVIASALNVPQTSHTYGDFMLFAKAAEFKQENPSDYMVEMAWVQSGGTSAWVHKYCFSAMFYQLFWVHGLSLRLRVLEAVEFLEIYLSTNPDASGYVEFHNFIKVLKLKTSMLSEKIFGFIDTHKIGKIRFKQFLLGSAHVLKQPLFRHACELSFSECVADGKNHISKSKLHDAISVGVLYLDEIEGLFSLFDVDADGKISKNDFVSCLRRHPLLIALFTPLLLHIGSSILDPTLKDVL